MQDIVDATRLFCYALLPSQEPVVPASYLLHTAIVLGISRRIVLGDNLVAGNTTDFTGLIASNRNLGAFIKLYHHLHRFLSIKATRRPSQLVGILHLRHTKAGAIGCRLDKTGHTEPARYFGIAQKPLLSPTDENAVGHIHTEATKIVVEHILIERHGLNEDATGRIRYMEQFKIALHNAILAGGAVDGDIGIVEDHGSPLISKEKSFLSTGNGIAILEVHLPRLSFHLHYIDIVALFVEEGVEPLGRPQ